MSEDATALIAQLVEGLEPGSLVTKFVVVAEVIDPSGGRAVWCDNQPGAMRWDTYGLLTYALEQERGAQHAEIARSEDE